MESPGTSAFARALKPSNLNSALNFPRAQTTGTYVNSLTRTIDDSSYPLKIGEPLPFGFNIGVANLVTYSGLFPTDAANGHANFHLALGCHSLILPEFPAGSKDISS